VPCGESGTGAFISVPALECQVADRRVAEITE
jgi:hypothetical protein